MVSRIFKPGDVVLSLVDPSIALTVEEIGTEELCDGVRLIHCVTMDSGEARRHWLASDRLILCRKTRFAVGNSFATVTITSRGPIGIGEGSPLVAMEKGIEELGKVRAERKRIVQEFIAANPGRPICYWYNWLADVVVNSKVNLAKVTERGCPALYDPDVDAEFDDELYPARADAAGNPIFPKVA